MLDKHLKWSWRPAPSNNKARLMKNKNSIKKCINLIIDYTNTKLLRPRARSVIPLCSEVAHFVRPQSWLPCYASSSAKILLSGKSSSIIRILLVQTRGVGNLNRKRDTQAREIQLVVLLGQEKLDIMIMIDFDLYHVHRKGGHYDLDPEDWTRWRLVSWLIRQEEDNEISIFAYPRTNEKWSTKQLRRPDDHKFL